MTHGLSYYHLRHPQIQRMTGEKSLNTTAILLIAIFVLVLLFYAVLGYL